VWQPPTLDEILEPGNGQDFSADILRRQARAIEQTLESLGAPVRVEEINRGPVVTQFGIQPLVVTNANGKETKVKISRIRALADDLALALEAKTLRVEAPIPGKGLVGIEVPNPEVSLVALRDVMESEAFAQVDSRLRLCLGQDVSGNAIAADLTAMPHMLIAGTTGSGKSVCINAIIAALLLQNTPDDLRFLMVDPKRVELTGYNAIPHLLSKVVVEMERVTGALQWVLREMDGRYRRLSKARATHIRDYNERVAPRLGEKRLPYIVVVIDELADLMMMAPQESERAICRIAQMARATGIHLVIATQRPSVDVVTGLIKANFPARIAFNVASAVDSRVILDMPGAEHLLGQGDMLFLLPDAPTPLRLQGAFVSDEELRRLVQYWKEQGRPEAISADKPVQPPLWDELAKKEPEVEYEDELLPDVIDVVLTENRASISLLQRKLRIGYTRAARIMDILEQNGAVGPQPPGGKAREVFPSAARALLHPSGDEYGR
jgi:S-DNA-T family DNA segregation ATPase FtsK/SpoIIIE